MSLGNRRDGKTRAGKYEAEARNEEGRVPDYYMRTPRKGWLESHTQPIGGLDYYYRHNRPPQNPGMRLMISKVADHLSINRHSIHEDDGRPDGLRGEEAQIYSQSTPRCWHRAHLAAAFNSCAGKYHGLDVQKWKPNPSRNP